MVDNILTFNFAYKEAYTSSIEFDTQIIEKHKGKEQRYPKWTYPKRTFTLKFDKNFSDRQKIEEFFIEAMLNGGKFNWTWEKETGGNGKTYLCYFEEEKLKQNIKNLGYTDVTGLGATEFFAVTIQYYVREFFAITKEALSGNF